MKNKEILDKIRALSVEKFYADYTEISGNKPNPNKYGIYDVHNSSVGEFMLMYEEKAVENRTVPCIDLRMPKDGFNAVIFNYPGATDEERATFNAARNFISKFKSRPSMFEYWETFDKFYYIMSSTDVRKAEADQHDKACAICDAITAMEAMGRQNTKRIKSRKNDVVSVRFPDGGLQRVIFTDVFHSDIDTRNPRAIQIEIPAAGISGIFNKDRDYKNEMVYNHAKDYLDLLSNPDKPMVVRAVNFCRTYVPVRRLSSQIINARQKGKSK
jgi:hypothetical protein